jgi:hypothetical protein
MATRPAGHSPLPLAGLSALLVALIQVRFIRRRKGGQQLLEGVQRQARKALEYARFGSQALIIDHRCASTDIPFDRV